MFNKLKKAIWLLNKENFREEYAKKVIKERIDTEQLNCLYTGKNQCILSSKDLNGVLLSTVIQSKKLLEEKGFPNTLKAKVEKHVLLGTEISELADAIKKGKGSNEEGEELADIAIRLANFLSANETYNQYTKLSKVFWKYEKEFPNMINVETYNTDQYHLSDIEIKYEIIQQMMIKNEAIRIAADEYMLMSIYNADPMPLVNLWFACLSLLALCDVYAKAFLPYNLQDYIKSKMHKNFKRPFRYNTCEEFNQ